MANSIQDDLFGEDDFDASPGPAAPGRPAGAADADQGLDLLGGLGAVDEDPDRSPAAAPPSSGPAAAAPGAGAPEAPPPEGSSPGWWQGRSCSCC
ncbi:hypothetical protein AUQ48_13005 [Kocuria flava]|uniref:Uncharacterized protein n=1 Tax=Kocuria flava TaxID=446860 RepID=A0A2N4T411_9MICC|nr:hypothetical protein [Kocuria flava]PLC12969.1 hypothetical protein AUQ48_13005 [Kocuria flava]